MVPESDAAAAAAAMDLMFVEQRYTSTALLPTPVSNDPNKSP